MGERSTRSPESVTTLPMVPLRDIVVFPHTMVPFVVGRKPSLLAVDRALAWEAVARDADAAVDRAAAEADVGAVADAIRNLIREDKVAQMYSAIQTGQASGMITLDQYLQDLLGRGLISKHDARRRAVNKETFQ